MVCVCVRERQRQRELTRYYVFVIYREEYPKMLSLFEAKEKCKEKKKQKLKPLPPNLKCLSHNIKVMELKFDKR